MLKIFFMLNNRYAAVVESKLYLNPTGYFFFLSGSLLNTEKDT